LPRHPHHHAHQRAVGITSGVAGIVATTLSSCRRTTPSLICIESDGVVANFSARQHPADVLFLAILCQVMSVVYF
jgi:hypothetical protein